MNPETPRPYGGKGGEALKKKWFKRSPRPNNAGNYVIGEREK